MLKFDEQINKKKLLRTILITSILILLFTLTVLLILKSNHKNHITQHSKIITSELKMKYN